MISLSRIISAEETTVMSSAKLNSYGGNLKKLSEANARDDQLQVIRRNRFKASLVDDPLRSSADITHAIEISRRK